MIEKKKIYSYMRVSVLMEIAGPKQGLPSEGNWEMYSVFCIQ